jgi:phosphohistidine swiveling domain-containing protein
MSGDRLQGTSVYSGTVMGRACVVTSLEQIEELKQGDILITHSTDVGWSPYFPLLSGVVTELGGLISHGEYASFSTICPLMTVPFAEFMSCLVIMNNECGSSCGLSEGIVLNFRGD